MMKASFAMLPTASMPMRQGFPSIIPERDVRAEASAPVGRLCRHEIADAGLDDLRAAGEAGVAVRNDVADAD